MGFTPFKSHAKAKKEDSISPIFIENFDLRNQVKIFATAKTNLTNKLSDLKNRRKKLLLDTKRLSKFEMAIHDKYVLGFSCFILFFVGAPLGAIIRKGGLGLPIVIGVVSFLAFHFIGIFAKNSAEDGSINPALASWFSTIIILPIGIFLTYRATTDQGLLNLGSIIASIKQFFSKKKVTEDSKPLEFPYTLTQEEEKTLSERSVNQLKDIVKNYKQYDYSENIRNAAIVKLSTLGITVENLKVQGYYLDKQK